MNEYKLNRTVTYRGKEITEGSIFTDSEMEKEIIEKLIKKNLAEKIKKSDDKEDLVNDEESSEDHEFKLPKSNDKKEKGTKK